MATISVLGSASRSLPPDLGTARVIVRLEGVDRGAVTRAAAALHARVTGEARRLEERGAVIGWTAGQVWTSTVDHHRGRQPPERRATATATVRAVFRDFAALGEWLASLAGTDGLELAGVEWALTEQHRREAEREVRREAILDARSRALAYAEALGFEGVELRTAAEPGTRQSGYDVRYAREEMAAGTEAYDLHPDDLEVEAAIVAEFTAR